MDCNAYCCIHLSVLEEKSCFIKLEGERCPYLDDSGKCKIHEDPNRPEICKLYHCYGAGPVSAALHELVSSVSKRLCSAIFQKTATDKAMEYIFQNLHSGERNIVTALSILSRVENKEEVQKIEKAIKHWNLMRASLAFAFYKILSEVSKGRSGDVVNEDLVVHFELSHYMSLGFNADSNFALFYTSERILNKANWLAKKQD